MTPALIAVLLFAVLTLGVATMALWQSDRARTRQMLGAADNGPRAENWFGRVDGRFRRTRAGRRVATMLAGSGRTTWSVLGFTFAVLAAASAVALATSSFAGKAAAVIVFFAVVAGVHQWLVRQQARRVEQFIAQLPELARLLSNGASAGLGVHRSLELAARELSEPARSEVEQVSGELAVGQSLVVALDHMSERLPSRELAVLVHTLVIQHRAGGGLVTALSRIAVTLEERKQLRREAKTASVASAFSGSAVMVIAGFAVVIVNVMSPGAIDTMLGGFLGRAALLVSVTLFVVGFLGMRRLAKVDV